MSAAFLTKTGMSAGTPAIAFAAAAVKGSFSRMTVRIVNTDENLIRTVTLSAAKDPERFANARNGTFNQYLAKGLERQI